MEMKPAHEFRTGEIIPFGVAYVTVLTFANGVLRQGDTVCIWFEDDSLISGTVIEFCDYYLVLKQGITKKDVRYEHIAYIAKKENGKWKLMREATDGKA